MQYTLNLTTFCELQVSIPKGSLCNLKAKFKAGLPPDAIYNIVTDPDNKRVFKNIKVCIVVFLAIHYLFILQLLLTILIYFAGHLIFFGEHVIHIYSFFIIIYLGMWRIPSVANWQETYVNNIWLHTRQFVYGKHCLLHQFDILLKFIIN